MGVRLALCFTVFAGPVSALTATCLGNGWSLDLLGEQAEFTFPAATQLDVPHTAQAEGADWPRALTLIGDRDTGILILHDRECEGGSHEAQMLTQRGQTPILLTGCCRGVSE
ncbi:MAG: hypothetical protein AAF714_06415 [Pseudomonadota bacterium]